MLAAVLVIGHAAAIAVAAAALPNSVWTLGLHGAIVLNGAWATWRHALLRHPGSVIALELRGEPGCNLRLQSGAWLECEILPSSYVTPQLIVLNLARDGSRFRRHVVIFPDSIAPDVHRRLRVRLRWMRLASDAEPPQASL